MTSPDLVAGVIINGLVLGVTLTLVAIGLSLIFGLMRVVNFAHGSFYMIGAYIAATLADVTGFVVALLAATLITAIVGAIVEYGILRKFYERNLILQLLVTLGIALVIRELIIFIYGTGGLAMAPPELLSGAFHVGFIRTSRYDIFLLFFGIAILTLVWLAYSSTSYGDIVRAATRDSEMVEILGINIKVLWTLIFMIGAGLAGLAGALAGPIRPVNPSMDFTVLLLSFVIVIFGGMGSLLGTIVAGLILGQAMALTSIFWLQGAEIVAFLILALTLLVKPEGLMGEPEDH